MPILTTTPTTETTTTTNTTTTPSHTPLQSPHLKIHVSQLSEETSESTKERSSSGSEQAQECDQRIQTIGSNFNVDQIEDLCARAWSGSDIQAFRALLSDMSIEAINHTNTRGQTALYCACRGGHVAHVETLLQIPGIDFNKGDTKSQNTPLHAAGWGSYVPIAAMLLWMGADINKSNSHNLSPREEAQAQICSVYITLNKQGVKGLAKQYPQVLNLRSEYAESMRRIRGGIVKTVSEIQLVPSILNLERAGSAVLGTNTLTMAYSSDKVNYKNPYTDEILDFYTGHL
eukprot:TRINITY_DN5877_c0_g1_i1.p1 TRINITY_DN5877_c0_g1~~TRINITY_DN5877_c0_g1_i1.p1  ORF type:complete len:288 (+),score=38.27 TRINITY_DN5877_c0_g1_i1:960-1823(+)